MKNKCGDKGNEDEEYSVTSPILKSKWHARMSAPWHEGLKSRLFQWREDTGAETLLAIASYC
jgi:hypothetical protein